MAIDRIADPRRARIGMEMRDDLVAIEIEIDPRLRTPPLPAAQRIAIESARRGKIVDGEGEMERLDRHEWDLAAWRCAVTSFPISSFRQIFPSSPRRRGSIFSEPGLGPHTSEFIDSRLRGNDGLVSPP
jgi:hypothetical protein